MNKYILLPTFCFCFNTDRLIANVQDSGQMPYFVAAKACLSEYLFNDKYGVFVNKIYVSNNHS